MSGTERRTDVSWEHARDFTDAGSGLTVRVMKLPLRYPKFSFEVGRIVDNDFKRHFRPVTRIENAQVNLTPFPTEVLVGLVAKAEHFVYEELQFIEDSNMEAKIFRESRGLHSDREPRKTGKTARKRAAAQAER